MTDSCFNNTLALSVLGLWLQIGTPHSPLPVRSPELSTIACITPDDVAAGSGSRRQRAAAGGQPPLCGRLRACYDWSVAPTTARWGCGT